MMITDAAVLVTFSDEWPTRLRRRHILRRRNDGTLAEVLQGFHFDGPMLVIRVDPDGLVPKRSRRVTRDLAAIRRDYEPYVPCRWALHCTEQATYILPDYNNYGRLTVCPHHGREFISWALGDQRDQPPEPECWCPDGDYCDAPEYCPAHGTPDNRGTEISAPQTFLTLEEA